VRMGSGGMRRSCQNGLPRIDRADHKVAAPYGRSLDLVCGDVQLVGGA